ncbi:hypothetical protein IQ13_1043 [Lacibacter cauensis]|uniref:Uncharacterized protein n=1 Tax=Lacibacter cauensis TaxID=510947 RepID=A0A562SYA1_9BACT|nr:hypothetical protein [Lacibacter cauensis]TWI85874.1 hypothetical protein IQ13_1043 [Lacibacter cauensis]
MERKKLIRITKNKVFLTPEMSLNLSQTSLAGTHLSFRSVQDIYFEVEVLDYDKVENKITLDVIDYQPKNIEKFKEQNAKAPVLFVHFKPLKWSFIERHLGSYTKSILLKEEIVIEDKTPRANEDKEKSFLSTFKSKAEEYADKLSINYNTSLPHNVEFKQREPVIEKITEEAKIYFKDVDFNLGFVAFSYKSKMLNNTYNLKIENYFLLPEFNAVKSYFPKAFGGKKQFIINITFTITDNVVTDIVTTSMEIAGINENIIDSIKRERVANLTSTPLRKSIDKSLFTSDDIFNSFDDDLKDGNVFKQTEEDILNFLIEIRNVRNAKHLQFLSGSKHSAKQKLRFTLKPLFGFLFFIEGETKNHFCWELLNSHATYLWSFDKIEPDVMFQFKRVEEIINIIRDMGREAYKNNFKSNKVDNDLSFCTIEHSNINSAFKEGFVEWQHRLKEHLV